MTAKRNPSCGGPESGYAMLLVFLMAAMIAIALYREVPRFAFEQQRAKEKLLIERGEQYKRAIQVFVRKMNRYPATIEELESTNNIRFLRKRYLDPMTGKDKWRLIHVNGGVLTDSIIKQKAPGQKDQPAANQNTFIAEGPGLAGSTDPTEQVNNPAMRRRASDNRVQPSPDAPDQPPPVEDTENPNPNAGDTDPNQNPIAPPVPTPATGAMPVQTMPGTPMNRFPFPNQGGIPGQPGNFPGQQANFPGQPGMLPGQQGGVVNQQNGFGQPTTPQSFSGGVYSPPPPGGTNTGNMQQSNGFGNQPTGQGFGAGGMQQSGFGQPAGFGQQATGFGQPASQAGFGDGTSAGQTGAQNNLGNMLGLNGPRPGGMSGLPGMGGTQIGGGIAGVASENKDASIIVYNERKKYNEWEFVYDKSKDRGLAGVSGNGGVPGTPAGQMGSMPQPPGFGNNPAGNNSPFGGNSSFGNNSGFGNNNSGFGNNNSSGFGGGSSFGQSAPIGQPSPPPPPPQQ